MAHKKGGGSSRNGRDSQGQRLGIKIWRRTRHQRQHYCPSARDESPSWLECRLRTGLYSFATAGKLILYETLPNGRKKVHVVVAAE